MRSGATRCHAVHNLPGRFGTKGSLVQIQSPRPLEGLGVAGEIHGSEGFLLAASFRGWRAGHRTGDDSQPEAPMFDSRLFHRCGSLPALLIVLVAVCCAPANQIRLSTAD